jgi:hypothetical protein
VVKRSHLSQRATSRLSKKSLKPSRKILSTINFLGRSVRLRNEGESEGLLGEEGMEVALDLLVGMEVALDPLVGMEVALDPLVGMEVALGPLAGMETLDPLVGMEVALGPLVGMETLDPLVGMETLKIMLVKLSEIWYESRVKVQNSGRENRSWKKL